MLSTKYIALFTLYDQHFVSYMDNMLLHVLTDHFFYLTIFTKL